MAKQTNNGALKHRIVRTAGIIAAACTIVALTSAILVPTWIEWNHDSTMKGFYSQPRNTMQVLFVGTSNAACGFSPNQLFQEHGICSYNLATEQQPLLSTYYLIQEAKRLHGDSLTTIVLDPSGLFQNQTKELEEMFTIKALTNMQLSPVKIEAMLACEERFNDVSALEELVPLLGYHSRWYSLESEDVAFADDGGGRAFTRGQHIVFSLLINNESSSTISLQDKLNAIPTETNRTEAKRTEAAEMSLESNRLIMADITAYCKDNGLDLLFVRLPRQNANDLQRKTILEVAEELNVGFLDLNTRAARSKMGFNSQLDIFSDDHLNIYGSRKAMAVVGDYLAEYTELIDCRGDSCYAFMEADCSKYNQLVADSRLQTCTNLSEYLALIDNENYISLIAIKDDAAAGLNESLRTQFAQIGLVNLSHIEFRESYIGILQGGTALLDHREPNIELGSRMVFALANGTLVFREQESQKGTPPANRVSLASGGALAGDKAVIAIGENDYSENGRGLNFVVLNRNTGEVIDTASFDTCGDCNRTSDIAS